MSECSEAWVLIMNDWPLENQGIEASLLGKSQQFQCSVASQKALVYHLLGFSSILLSLCLLALLSSKSGICPSQSHRVLALVLDHNILAEAVTYNATNRLKRL